jgi:hypothetical protein
MTYTFRALLAVVLVVSLAAGPVATACCDDFWSCAAAIATGGLSCAVEDLINSIRSMVHNVETLVNSINRNLGEVTGAALAGVKAAGDDLRGLVQGAENDTAEAMRKAAEILNRAEHPPKPVRAPIVGGGTAAQVGSLGSQPQLQPTPKTGATSAPAAAGLSKSGGTMVAPAPVAACEQATVLDLLRAAEAEARKQRALAQEKASFVRDKARAAEDAVRSKFDFATRMANDLLIRPLTDLKSMLDDLIHHPERIFNPVDMVNDLVTRITNNIARTMDDITDELVRDANAALALAREPAHVAQDTAAAAKHLVGEMEKLEKNRTQTNCDKLRSLLPRPNITLVAHFQTAGVGIDFSKNTQLVSRALLKTDAGKIKGQAFATSTRASLKQDWNVLAAKHAALLHPVLPPGAQNSLKQHEDAMFRGMNASQVRGKKPELVAEARRRFANDPKTLEKVLAYLDRTIEARARAVPAVAR